MQDENPTMPIINPAPMEPKAPLEPLAPAPEMPVEPMDPIPEEPIAPAEGAVPEDPVSAVM